jgi:hypothetical protein
VRRIILLNAQPAPPAAHAREHRRPSADRRLTEQD